MTVGYIPAESMTVQDLKRIAKEHDVKGYYRMDKAKLIKVVDKINDAGWEGRQDWLDERKKARVAEQIKLTRHIGGTKDKVWDISYKDATPELFHTLCGTIWSGALKIVEAKHIDGYWYGKIYHTGEGITTEKPVRLDYVLNYMRLPRQFERFPDLQAIKKMVTGG